MSTVEPPDLLKPGQYASVSFSDIIGYMENIGMFSKYGKPVDFTGKRFGRLVVLYWVSGNPTRWMCRCDCGVEKPVEVELLKNGGSRSCGCLRSELLKSFHTTHGLTKTSTYRIWSAMLRRCRNPKSKDYARYGARGIKFCERWLKFENFLADMGMRPDGLSLDRWPNNNGNYEPGNCRWATVSEQNWNRGRDSISWAFGIRMHNSDWASNFCIPEVELVDSLKKGENLESVIINKGSGHELIGFLVSREGKV